RTGLKGGTEVQRRRDHRVGRVHRRPRYFVYDKESYLLGRVKVGIEIRIMREKVGEEERRRRREEKAGGFGFMILGLKLPKP
ncbi:hypothetical protein LINPERHAP1_LOCUS31102, partial [Linum perenne]